MSDDDEYYNEYKFEEDNSKKNVLMNRYNLKQ